MKTLPTALYTTALLLSACTADDNLFSDYRVFFKNSFVTNTGTLFQSAALGDSVQHVSDKNAIIKGYFEYTDPEEISRYGHCWVKGGTTPIISNDSANCTIYDFRKRQTGEFESFINGLMHETEYSVRSFIITDNGTVGYNPQVTRFVTTEPHDEWFSCPNLTNQLRCDGVSVSTVINGDTISFFGLGRNASTCFADFYQFNSKTGQITRLKDFPGKARWGAVAFALSYTDRISKEEVQCVYVGLGSSDSDGSNYENDFYVYRLDKSRWEKVQYIWHNQDGEDVYTNAFTADGRTGSIAFSIDEYGFVGMGENAIGACYNDIYVFMMERDHNKWPMPNRGYFYTMSNIFPFGGRKGASAFVIDKSVYIIGGQNDKGECYKDLIQGNFINPGSPESSTAFNFNWAKRKQFPGSPRAFAACATVGGYAYYGTGEGGNKGKLFSDFYRYDAGNDTWTSCTEYKNGEYQDAPGYHQNAQIAPAVSRSFTLTGNDRCYIGSGFVGEDSNIKFVNYLWEYRP